MAKVTEKCREIRHRPVFICDFSPPRGSTLALLDGAREMDGDLISVAYSPGKAVRLDSAVAAYTIRQQTGKDVSFTLVTRDMNKLATQNHLLGASMLGLENVIVVGGDPFNERELTMVKDVSDFNSTELIRAIKAMNEGVDYRGLKLRAPTDLCVGATIDLGRGVQSEVGLARRKADAGVDFLVSQPVYDLDRLDAFQERYATEAGSPLPVPLFIGLQVLERDGIIFSDVPDDVKSDLEAGRPGTEIAIELLQALLARGLTNIYLIAPILRGGRRDYAAAQRVLEASGAL